MYRRDRRGHVSTRRVKALVVEVADIDFAELRVELRRLSQSPVANGAEQSCEGERVEMKPDAEDERRHEEPVEDRKPPLSPGQQNGPYQRLMDRRALQFHQRIAGAKGKSAIMSWVAPSAPAPPRATADILRAPVPCSLKVQVRPAAMTAMVVAACATVPCRSIWMVLSGWSHGRTPMPVVASA